MTHNCSIFFLFTIPTFCFYKFIFLLPQLWLISSTGISPPIMPSTVLKLTSALLYFVTIYCTLMVTISLIFYNVWWMHARCVLSRCAMLKACVTVQCDKDQERKNLSVMKEGHVGCHKGTQSRRGFKRTFANKLVMWTVDKEIF